MNKIQLIALLLACITAKRHHKDEQQQDCILYHCQNQLFECLVDQGCKDELDGCMQKFGNNISMSEFSECSSDERPLRLWICIFENCKDSSWLSNFANKN